MTSKEILESHFDAVLVEKHPLGYLVEVPGWGFRSPAWFEPTTLATVDAVLEKAFARLLDWCTSPYFVLEEMK